MGIRAAAASAALAALALVPGAAGDGGPPGATTLWDLSAGGGALWEVTMTTRAAGLPPRHDVLRRDPADGRVLGRTRVPGPAFRVDAGARAVWVAAGPRLLRLDAATGRLAGATRVPGSLSDVAAGGGAVWAIDEVAARLWRFDPATGRPAGPPLRPIRLRPTAVEAGGGAAWLATWGPRRPGRPGWDRGRGRLLRIAPRTGAVEGRAVVGHLPSDVALGGGAAWVANAWDGTVQEVRFAGGAVTAGAPIRLPGVPAGRSAPPIRIAVIRGVVWAAAGTRLVAVDAATGAVLETRDLAPGSAVAVAAGAPGAWVGLQLGGGVPIRRL